MSRSCQSCRAAFTIDSEDLKFYEKIDVPPPTWCYLCRAQRRLAFRNERCVYKRKSDYSGEMTFSGYAPDAPAKVYEKEIWQSDKWDPLAYGREYDFARPFFEQFMELHREVPRPALGVIDMVNSDYCNNASRAKNCYLMFNFVDSENCRYGARVSRTKDSIDILSVDKSELIHESFEIHGSSRVLYSENCESCTDIYFSKNLSNCTNCYGCANLRGKSYCIFNRQYSRDEYMSKFAELKLGSRSFVREEMDRSRDLWMQYPERYLHGVLNQNVSGEYIYNSKNVKDSYIVEGGENVRYSQYLYTPTSKDAYDHTNWGEGSELTYECLQVGMNIRNAKFSAHCWPGLQDIEYSIYCMSSSNLFGCVGIRSGQYCILNKQYTPEEYAALVPKVKEHMREMPYTDRVGRIYSYGEFFPYEVCPWGYNETIAQEFFPLSKEIASQHGVNWKEDQKREHEPTMAAADIPDSIEDVEDGIIAEVVACSHGGDCDHHCTSAFKMLPEDISFYKRLNIPLPDLCPNCRHYRRARLRNPMQTWHRKCQCPGSGSENGRHKNSNQAHLPHSSTEPCPNEFETSYAPERPEIVYCEQCYQAELA